MQLAEEARAIFGRALCEVIYEPFDLIPARVSKCGSPAVVGGIGLHESGVELVLADQQAEAIPQTRLAVRNGIRSGCGRTTV